MVRAARAVATGNEEGNSKGAKAMATAMKKAMAAAARLMATAMKRAMAREGNGEGGKKFGSCDSGGRQ